MRPLLAENWWVVAIRGVLAIGFGLLAFVLPGMTVEVLILSFGVYALLDGIFTLVSALRSAGRQPRWWALLLEGLLSIVAGVLTFVIPGVSATFIVLLIALWAITTGASEIGAAIRLRKEIVGEWLLGLGGVVSVLFGLLMLLLAGAGPLPVILLIGAYAILFGVLVLALAIRLRFAQYSAPRPG